MNKNSIAVIGAGITGIMTAYYFAKKGYRVHIYEKERYVASKCSYANGGQISVSNSEVWNSWGNVKKGLKWLGDSQAPLLIRPTLDLNFYKWMWKFLLNCRTATSKINTANTINMGVKSRDLYLELIKETGLEFDQLPTGILHFYKNQEYFDHAKSLKTLYESNGCEWTILSKNAVFTLEPTLAHGRDSHDILGGVMTKQDWTGDINKFCKNLMSYLIRTYEVEFIHVHSTATTPQYVKSTLAPEYKAVIICAGVDSQDFTEEYDDDILIYPVKGYSITVDIDKNQEKLAPIVSLLDDQAKIVTSRLGDRLRVAGTAEFTGKNYDITRSRIDPLLAWTRRNFPHLDSSNYSSWACLRPMTPNMLPVVKKSKCANIWYNTGHGHLGWTLAAYSGNLISDMIV